MSEHGRRKANDGNGTRVRSSTRQLLNSIDLPPIAHAYTAYCFTAARRAAAAASSSRAASSILMFALCLSAIESNPYPHSAVRWRVAVSKQQGRLLEVAGSRRTRQHRQRADADDDGRPPENHRALAKVGFRGVLLSDPAEHCTVSWLRLWSKFLFTARAGVRTRCE